MSGSGLVSSFLVSHMAADDTTANRTGHRMVACIVAGYPANRSAFQTAFGIGAGGRAGKRQCA